MPKSHDSARSPRTNNSSSRWGQSVKGHKTGGHKSSGYPKGGRQSVGKVKHQSRRRDNDRWYDEGVERFNSDSGRSGDYRGGRSDDRRSRSERPSGGRSSFDGPRSRSSFDGPRSRAWGREDGPDARGNKKYGQRSSWQRWNDRTQGGRGGRDRFRDERQEHWNNDSERSYDREDRQFDRDSRPKGRWGSRPAGGSRSFGNKGRDNWSRDDRGQGYRSERGGQWDSRNDRSRDGRGRSYGRDNWSDRDERRSDRRDDHWDSRSSRNENSRDDNWSGKKKWRDKDDNFSRDSRRGDRGNAQKGSWREDKNGYSRDRNQRFDDVENVAADEVLAQLDRRMDEQKPEKAVSETAAENIQAKNAEVENTVVETAEAVEIEIAEIETNDGAAESNNDATDAAGEPVKRRKPRAKQVLRAQQRRHHFTELGVPDELIEELASQGIDEPFPIQRAAIPDAMAGRDVLGRGQTGSGKTLAFSLPVVTRLAKNPKDGREPRALLMAPTRELAMQVNDVITPLAKAEHLTTVLVGGGMSYTPQLRALDRGVDIIVATPGRLIDLMERGAADLSSVEISVLDEADEMADMGFMEAVSEILDATSPDAQRLLFSATLDHQVDALVRRYLKDPVVHGVDSAQASVQTMRHELWGIAARDKSDIIAQAANRPGRTLVFVRTQADADRTSEDLRDAGIMAGALHGGLPQGMRARVLNAFRKGEVPVLVATDVAARGIHVDDVSLVLQADPPHDAKDYLHRAGRTARAGEDGLVASLVLPRQKGRMARLMRDAGVHERPFPVRSGERLTELTGGVPPTGDPIADGQYRALIAPPKQVRRHGGHGGGGRRRFNNSRQGGRSRGWNK